MNLIDGDRYERRFKALLSDLNIHRKDKFKYNVITEKMCGLVGEMLGEIDSHNVQIASKTGGEDGE